MTAKDTNRDAQVEIADTEQTAIAVQDRIDFNEPHLSGKEAVAKNLGQSTDEA